MISHKRWLLIQRWCWLTGLTLDVDGKHYSFRPFRWIGTLIGRIMFRKVRKVLAERR